MRAAGQAEIATHLEAGHHLFQAGEIDRAYEILGSASEWLQGQGWVREGLRIIADLEAKKALIDKQVDIISDLKRQRSIPVNLMNEINLIQKFHNWII